MDKITLDIPSTQDGKWGSYISKYPGDSGKVPPNALTINSRNFVTAESGYAEKIMGGTIWNPNSSLGAPPIDQYEAIFSSGERLLIFNVAGMLKGSSGNNLFSVIQGGFNATANFEFSSYSDRVYGDNGIDAPIVIDIATSYGGVSYSFTLAKVKPMGAQPPVTAPTATLVVDSTAGQIPAGAHTYKITFVYYNGQEESNGGPASAPVTNDATHTSTNLTAIPIGGYGVTARNIYRDNNDGNWLLLDTILNNTATTYHDILPIGGTPTPIPTENGLPPVFKYIANYLDRMFVAGIEGAPATLQWSNAGEPDVFNPVNTVLCRNDDVITAVFVFNGLLYVFGQHSLGVILGTTDSTFYYSPISTTVGCVDNRSIAVRALISVPTMIWLSALPNRGFYYTQGSAVQFMSEYIDDLIPNIAQVTFLERSNTQNTLAEFEGDTSSPGIDLTTNPGAIQTINPTAVFDTATEWNTGTLVNLVQVGDELQNILGASFDPDTIGSVGGSVIQSPSPDEYTGIPLSTLYTGESNTSISPLDFGLSPNEHYAAQQVVRPSSGTITSLSIQFQGVSPGGSFQFFWAPDVFGNPGTINIISGLIVPPTSVTVITSPVSIPIFANVPIWIGVTSTRSFFSGFCPIASAFSDPFSTFPVSAVYSAPGTGGSWVRVPSGNFPGNLILSLGIGYVFIQTITAAAGNWISPIYDTLSNTNDGTGMRVILEAFNSPASTVSVVVQGSNSPTGPFTTTDTINVVSSYFSSITGGSYRYWRIVATLSTSDPTQYSGYQTSSVAFEDAQLGFNVNGVWTSPSVLCTTDITSLVSLIASVFLNSFASYTASIATSADNITYTSFGPIGSATPQKWAKLQLTLTAGNAFIPGAVASSLVFDWDITSQIESTPIDTAATPPAGWGPFQFDSVGGGTTTAYFRTASTSGGLASATYIAIANGSTPTNTVLEWVQWKLVFTASADSFPQVNSVTVNWFLGNGTTIRCATIFFNKSYYLSCALTGSNVNNLLIEFDQDGLWRIHSAFNMATLGTYFNNLYYGSALAGNVLTAFNQNTEAGTPIIFDLRGKCFDYGDILRLKSVRSLKVAGLGTGTIIYVFFSLDRGNTWNAMLNSSGTIGFQTPNDGLEFVEYFIPNYDGGYQTGGRTVTYRIVSNDANPCAILRMSPTVLMRKGKALREITGF